MPSPKFAEIMNKKAGEAERVPPTPAGHWLFLVETPTFGTDTGGKKNDYVDFLLRPIQPMEDVEMEAVEEIGLEKITKKTLHNTKYLTEDALWALDEFLENVCEIEPSGRSYKQLIPEAKGKQVVGLIIEGTSADGKRPISYVDKDNLMSVAAWNEAENDDGLEEDDED